MAKYKGVIIVLCVIFFSFFIQACLLNIWTIWGIKANIILTVLVAICLYLKPSMSIPCAFAVGIISDLVFTSSIGKYLISYLIITLIILFSERLYNKENVWAVIGLCFACTFMFEFILCIYYFISDGIMPNIFQILHVAIKGAVINSIFEIFFTKIFKKHIKE